MAGAASRAQALKQLRAQPRARSHRLVAPVGGLNARDAQANMPETDALICDNFFVQPTYVEIRNGHLTLATFTGNAETVMAYNGLASAVSQLLAAVNNSGTRSIFRVDNAGGGAVGAPVVGGAGNVIQAITNATYDYAQFGTGAAEVLYLVNGADPPLLFDGTTWYSISTVSVPYALTGGPTSLSSLSQVAVYKYRLWFVQQGTFNVYYLPQNVFAGALTLLNLGPLFKMGGFLQTVVTVSIDNAAGANDYIAFVSNVGEVIVFQGYDPSNAPTAWALSAHFRIGRPVCTGRRAWQKLGSDALIIGADGFILMSEALLTDRSQEKNAVSDKIRKSVTDAVSSYGTFPGWQVILYPIGNKVIVNTPITGALGQSYQYVMNTLNGSWATWGLYQSPLNAFHWEVFGDELYYGTNGSVQQADQGQTDAGNAIVCTIKPAFSHYEDPGHLKRWTMCQPIFQVNGQLSLSITMNVDFDVTVPTGTIPLSQGNLPLWNVSFWNTPTFWGDATSIQKPWVGLVGVGYYGTITMQISAKNLSAKWQATNFLYEPGGEFYGVG